MRKRTLRQMDAQIKKIEKRLNRLKSDRALIALGIEPRNQLTIFLEPPPKPERRPEPAEQLLLV